MPAYTWFDRWIEVTREREEINRTDERHRKEDAERKKKFDNAQTDDMLLVAGDKKAGTQNGE